MTSPSFANDVILLMPFSQTTSITDIKKHQLTVYGNPNINSQVGRFNNGSLQLHGLSNEYLKMAASNDLDLHIDDFTIEASFCPTSNNTACLYSSELNYDGAGASLYILKEASDLVLKFFLQDSGANTTLVSVNTIALNNWHEAAISRQSGSLYLFLNGNLEASYSGTSVGSVDFSNGSYIGKDFSGLLNDFRLSKNWGYTASYQISDQPMSYQLDAIDFFDSTVNEIAAFVPNAIELVPLSSSIEQATAVLCGFDFGGINTSSQQLPIIHQVLTVAQIKELASEGVQTIQDSAGSYCLFSLDITKVGTLIADSGWVDEHKVLWIKPDGVTIGSQNSSADIALDSLELLFKRLYHNDNCQLYTDAGAAIAKTNLHDDWANNCRLAVFGNIVGSTGITSLICSGVLITHLSD